MSGPETTETRRSYDLVAERYAAEIGDELQGKPLDRGLLDAFAEFAAGRIVVDVGCGPAHVAAYLAGRGVQTFGLDLSPAMCAAAGRATSLPVCAAELTQLPIRSQSVSGIVCMYAVIHLDTAQRGAAYAEFARVLAHGGRALIAFQTGDAEYQAGDCLQLRRWWGADVELTFRYLDPHKEAQALNHAGLEIIARLDRGPYPNVEHPSHRSYLMVQRR